MKGFLISCALLVAFSAPTARAAITSSGDVIPYDPYTWTSSTESYVGKTTTGSLTVDGGSDLLSGDGYVGYNNGSAGTVMVNGSGSTWTNDSYLFVGLLGSGTLNITGSGNVSNTDGYIGYSPGSMGMATVSGSGSTWTNSGHLNVGNDGSGTSWTSL
jgi:T5SS/PEP-CTERM-associated repeat protein